MALLAVKGVYEDGQVVLDERPAGIEHADVVVTFLTAGGASAEKTGPEDLRARGIGEAQAADLRARLKTFAEDWDRSDMEAYDAL